MDTAALGRWVHARHMVLSGYISRVVMAETGLSYKQVRRLYKDLVRDGYTPKPRSRAFRGGATLIRGRAAKIQAALLMQLYRNIGGEGGLGSVDIAALDKAFHLYRAMRGEVPEMVEWVSFTISDAWCLAAELTSAEAMFEACDVCGCTYFTSVNQKSCLECPFCGKVR